MADKLEKELLDIQEKLGGTREVPPEGTADKLQWHLDKLEELAGGGGSGVSDIKVDGASIVSDGQANIITKSPYDPETNPLATMADAGGGSADFDALGQVQVSTSQAGTTVLTFPKQVLPLRLYLENYQDPISGNEEVYFNYVYNQILNANGNVISNTSCYIVDEQVVLTFDKAFEFTQTDADTLYWIFNNTEDVVESTYALLHPNPLPNVTLQDWNKYLHINQSNGKVEWKNIEPEAKKITGNGNTGNLFFGRIKPWNKVSAWKVVYEIEIAKTNQNYDSRSFAARVTVLDNGGSNTTDYIRVLSENRYGISTGYTANTIIWGHVIQAITSAGLAANCGHLIGANFNISTTYNYNIYVKVIETERCDVEVFDSLTEITDLSENSYKLTTALSDASVDFNSTSIQNARFTVNVTTAPLNPPNAKYYIVGTTESQNSRGSGGTTQLYGAYGNQTYFDRDGYFHTQFLYATSVFATNWINSDSGLAVDGGTEYCDGYICTDADDNRYVVNLPRKNGTLATLDDCGGDVPIVDLTNINNND